MVPSMHAIGGYTALYSSVCTARCRSPLLVISSYIKLEETQLILFPLSRKRVPTSLDLLTLQTINVLFSYV